MTYVVAGYALVFGGLGLYAGRLVVRARRAAAGVLERVAHSESTQDVIG